MTVRKEELEVCHRLKSLREEARLSQMELALAAGVSQNMIAYIENGKRTPSLTTLLKLCNALNVNPEVLFRNDESRIDNIREQLHKYIDYYVR